jgi:hypothetical protein
MSGSLREGLLSLIRRVLGSRHGIPDFSPQEDFSAPASDLQASVDAETSAAASRPELTSVQSAQPAATASQAATAAGLASIRLIFADGSVVPLPEGSLEGRKAQYLARRVLEAGKGS